MTKFQILILMLLELIQLQEVLIKHVEYIMFPHSPVLLFQKDTKDKFQKLYLIHKAIRFFQQVLIKQLVYGMLKQEKVYKYYKVMKIKSFHVCSIMKVTLLSLVQKIILVKYGEIVKFIRKKSEKTKIDKIVFFHLIYKYSIVDYLRFKLAFYRLIQTKKNN